MENKKWGFKGWMAPCLSLLIPWGRVKCSILQREALKHLLHDGNITSQHLQQQQLGEYVMIKLYGSPAKHAWINITMWSVSLRKTMFYWANVSSLRLVTLQGPQHDSYNDWWPTECIFKCKGLDTQERFMLALLLLNIHLPPKSSK